MCCCCSSTLLTVSSTTTCTGSFVRRSRDIASRFCKRCITLPSGCVRPSHCGGRRRRFCKRCIPLPSGCVRPWHCVVTKRSFGKCWHLPTGPNCTRRHLVRAACHG